MNTAGTDVARPAVDHVEVARRVERIRERIDRAGGARRVRLVAVTKGFGPDAVAAALSAGVVDIGESYARESVDKLSVFDRSETAITVHFIGRLQRNKVRMLTGLVDLWQSVDREGLVDELAKRAPGAAVLVQANLSGEPAKGGCGLDEVEHLVAAARDSGLDVRGLMGVGPAGDPRLAEPGFVSLARLTDRLGLEICSMGMSHDLEIAVGAGSTMVRVGTDLFGPRPRPPATSGDG